MKRVAILLVLLTAAAASAQTAAKFPNGVFRTTITDADLRKGHATNDIPENHGTFTLTITANGHWVLSQKAPNPLSNPLEKGVYFVKGSTVDFKTKQPPEYSGVGDYVSWRFDGAYLHLKLTRSDDPAPESYVIYGAHPWRKIK